MSDEYKGADLLAIEEKLEAAFEYAADKSRNCNSYENETMFGRSAAELAEAVLKVRERRMDEERGGKVAKPLKMGD